MVPSTRGWATTGKPNSAGSPSAMEVQESPRVVGAVDPAVVLGVEHVGLGRGPGDLVDALAPLGVLDVLRHELDLDPLVRRLPGGAAVGGAVDAAGRHRHVHPLRVGRGAGAACGSPGRRRRAPTAAGAGGPRGHGPARTSRPRSVERHSADGSVPAYTTPGSAGDGASDQIASTDVPVSSGNASDPDGGVSQVAPRSSECMTCGPMCQCRLPMSSRGVPSRLSMRDRVDLAHDRRRARSPPSCAGRRRCERSRAPCGCRSSRWSGSPGTPPRRPARRTVRPRPPGTLRRRGRARRQGLGSGVGDGIRGVHATVTSTLTGATPRAA